MSDYSCESNVGMEELIEVYKKEMLNKDDAYYLSEFFKVYGDETRIKIIHLLAQRELCVHEISGILEMNQSAISHQLKVLRNNKLVKPRKNGKHVFYSLVDDHVIQILNNGLEHVHE